MKMVNLLSILLAVFVVQISAQAADKTALKNSKLSASSAAVNQQVAPIEISDAVRVRGLKLSNLSIGAPDTAGARNGSVVIRNDAPQPIASTRLHFAYWTKTVSSPTWHVFYGSVGMFAFTGKESRTYPIRFGLLEGTTDFRVTLHQDNSSNPIISEVSATVSQ
jgi:hypothetical protein